MKKEDWKLLFLDLIDKKLVLSCEERVFIEKVLDFFLDSWENRKIEDKCHSPQHFYNVLSLAFKIIKNENLKLTRKELLSLIVAVLFHDIGLFFVKKTK
jgi:HD superfamily phosphodiesterase